MSEAKRIPDIVLEQYLLGELAEEKARQIEKQLSTDTDARARLEALKASNGQILADMPVHRAVADIERKLRLAEESGSRKARKSWFLLPAAATAAVALIALLVFVAMPPADSAKRQSVSGILAKGDAVMTVYRKTASGTETLADGSRARRGDTLQIGYTAAGMRYGVIASLDGRGTVTLHLPGENGPAQVLKSGTALLPVSYELDDAPGFERFFFITSMQPFSTGDVSAALKKLYAAGNARTRPPEISKNLNWYSVLVIK